MRWVLELPGGRYRLIIGQVLSTYTRGKLILSLLVLHLPD